MIGAVMLLHPGIVRNAVLLRGMNVLESMPAAGTPEKANVLMLSGEADPYGRFAEDLERLLAARGASVEHRLLPAGHDIGPADLELAKAYKERVVG
jgi:phospholipase/carboxylesterase